MPEFRWNHGHSVRPEPMAQGVFFFVGGIHMPQTLSARNPALDAIRAVAIVMVVITHVTSSALYLPVGSADWWGGLFWGSLVRPSVPLFFMCSGALMLGRDIPLKRLYRHNLLRILVAMLVWAFLYQVYYLLPGGFTLAELWDAVKHVLVLDHEFHFYYLHILILVYIFVPVVRTFTRNASKREMEYLLVVWFVTGIAIPLLKYFWPFTLINALQSWYLMPMAYSSIGFCVLGHYLYRYGGTIRRLWYGLALLCGFALVFVGSAVTSLSSGSLSTIFMEGMSPGPMLMAAGLFGLMLQVRHWPESIRRFTSRLAQAAFCIYLCHVFPLYLLQGWGVTASAWFPWLSIPGLTLLILALSWLVYEILHRIPVVKTYLI